MSTVIEQTPEASFTPTERQLKSRTLVFNARKVASKRYSVKDLHGNPIEEWPAIVKRVIDHVSKAETDQAKHNEFHQAMTEIMLNRVFAEHSLPRKCWPRQWPACRLLCSRNPRLHCRHHGPCQGYRDDSSNRRRHWHDLRVPAPRWRHCQLETRYSLRARFLHEHRQSGNRCRETRRCSPRREYGNDASHPPRHSPLYPRQERSALPR